VPVVSIRTFGRKAGRMGQRLQKLDELAHRGEHLKAKEKRKNKKESGKGRQEVDLDELVIDAEDENETIFDVEEDNNSNEASLPSVDDVKSRMIKAIDSMEYSFRSIRGDETTPDLFDSVKVKVYGTISPLSAVAQVVITSPTQATLTCFDPATAPSVRDGVRDMEGMNFNPILDENVVIVPIPRMSKERRQALVKQLGKTAENIKQRIRGIRRGAQNLVKKGKDGKLGPGISKDDAFRIGKEIDDVTEECIKNIIEIVETKQHSIIKV